MDMLPLFPTTSGSVCTKLAMADSIQAMASLTGEELTDEEGRRRFTGHTFRVTGAQHLARVGVPLHLIQLQARWALDSIMRYVRTAPLQNLTGTCKRCCTGVAEKAARLSLALESHGQ
eukprot:418806-Amphidinium_carterae.1